MENLDTNKNDQKPFWFKILLNLSLMPILICPFVFYGSIFIFDHPSSTNEALLYLIFFGVNSYPLLLIINKRICNKIFHKYKLLSIILSVIPILLLISFLSAIIFN